MSLFEKLQNALSGSPSRQGNGASDFYEVVVRCRRCGEILTGQINLKNDLSIDYETGQYFIRKSIMGSGENRCFERVQVKLTFDSDRRLLSREASGGAFVEREDEPPGAGN